LIATTEVLAAAAWRTTAIVARRILLRGIVLMAEILGRGGVGFGLALFGFRVQVGMRGSVGVVMFFDGGVFFVIVNLLCMVAALVFVFAMLVFTVRFVEGFGLREIVMSRLVGVFDSVFDSVQVAGFGGVTDRFAWQHFGMYGDGNLWRRCSVRLRVPVAVIVILKIFENVADVQEGVAVKPDVHESGLHTRKHPRDTAFVDTADQRELFFALDVNFD
jgi:hypothetical protein